MFEDRPLPTPVLAIRDTRCPDALVLDVERDFETLDPAVAEDLGLLVDGLEPHSYPEDWLPPKVPAQLEEYASGDFTIGAPGDGSVVWTRQTDPPVVLVKPRVDGSPESFVDFLIASALVEVSLDSTVPAADEGADRSGSERSHAADGVDRTGPPGGPPPRSPPPEHFLGFFRGQFPELHAVTPLSPADTYQLAAALYDAWLGLHTRNVFAGWLDTHPELGAAWQDAGDQLEDRLDGLSGEVARGETSFAEAAELACAAIKHAMELPAPYAALDTHAYRRRGPSYAIAWAEKTFEALE